MKMTFTLADIKREYYDWLRGGFAGAKDKYGILFVDFVKYLENKYGKDNHQRLQERKAIKKTPKKRGR